MKTMIEPISATLVMLGTKAIATKMSNNMISDKTYTPQEDVLCSSTTKKDEFELSKLTAGFNLGFAKAEAEFERKK